MSEMSLWERRFRAPKMTLPHWSRGAPDRTVYETNESGIWQVHRWDASTGERRQVSDHPVGVLEGFATLDGAEVIFWQEDTGDETGRWMVRAWEEGGAEPFVEGVPTGWQEGIAQAPGLVALGISDRDGFAIYSSIDGEPAKEIARSTEWMMIAGGYDSRSDIAGLSGDGTLLAVEHAEHGDLIHPALKVLDPRTGEVLGERHDEGLALIARAWSPVPGDRRLGVVHERGDRKRPAIWDLADDSWTDLMVDLPGDVLFVDWWPGADAVLLSHEFEGRHELVRYDVATGAVSGIETPPGTIADARVRPDGTVWFLHSDGTRRHRILDETGNEPVRVQGMDEPAGRPHLSWHFTNRSGQQVHGFTIEPEGEGPWPVIVFTHGGPHWLYEDRYIPEAQAYADLGFLVAMVNYRGSTGYGRAWRDALTGDVGFADVDDVTDGLQDLIDRGVADPKRAVIAGWSWGGYITLMEVGREPGRWIAAVAGVPVGDYVQAYEEEAPSLQAMDRALMGGSPEEVPDRFERGNPISYVDRVQAPVLFVIGENDSRCPLGQALAYVDRMKQLGKPQQTYLYSTGHGSNETDEEVRQQRVIMDFLKEHVPGLLDVP
jgi:dipeptidyl aminopeptidase/acylaminoacyl peptidase